MTPDELFQRHPLPWSIDSGKFEIEDANGDWVTDDTVKSWVDVANAYPRAALAERAVELLEKHVRVPNPCIVLDTNPETYPLRGINAEELAEVKAFLADARRVLGREGT